MYIDKKHIYLATGDNEISYLPSAPFMYVDGFFMKPNLKHNWHSNHAFQFEIGIGGKVLSGTFMWGFVKRERTESEEKMYQTTLELIEALNKGAKIESID